MRGFVLATMLLVSSSLCSIAQEQGKAPAATPQVGIPAQTDQNSQPQRDQRTGRDQPKTEDCPDSKMRRGDGDRMSRDEREMSQDSRMHRDRETGRDREPDRGRYSDRGDRDWDRADRDRDNGGYVDADRPRRRVKVCFEYDNGDEYCRYRQ